MYLARPLDGNKRFARPFFLGRAQTKTVKHPPGRALQALVYRLAE